MNSKGLAHWDAMTAQWSRIGPPLRPCPEDLALMRELVARYAAEPGRSSDGLLLGVTPEIATQDWGSPMRLLAADNSYAMVASTWPGNTPLRSAICADWLRLPLRQASFDVVLADGSLSTQVFPDGYEKLGGVLANCLKPGGMFIVRAFCRPPVAESVDEVFTDLRQRRIGSFHAFKWRLAMAVQGVNPAQGVRLADIWDAYLQHVPDHGAMAAISGWPVGTIATIDVYRGSPARYTFPSQEETASALARHFAWVDSKTGSYELADRCPLLAFKSSQAGSRS